MEYEIIATLGPSSRTPAIWQAMQTAGATAFRLNTSHLSVPQLQTWLEQLQAFSHASKVALPIVLDLQGSKWRLGDFPACRLEPGRLVKLVYGKSAGQDEALPVPHHDFFAAAPASDGQVILNDAKIRLAIQAAGPDWLQATVVVGGPISSHKGITFSASGFRQESLSQKDQAILDLTHALDHVRYAVSYVRDAAEMERYRALFGPGTYLIAKIERQPALTEAPQIAGIADELWLCRGDLGAELGIKAMAEAVSEFSHLPAHTVRPIVMAGQVLEHMTGQPAPTRSEICYLYDTLRIGYAGVVLSDETAIGQYPVESCQAAALFRAWQEA